MQSSMSTVDTILFENAPEIPGLHLRKFRGEQDYPLILAVINAAKSFDQIERNDTLEDIIRNYSHLVNSDPYEDMLFAEINGEMIGYCRSEWAITDKGEWQGFHLAFVDPAWRRRGIGSTFLRYNEGRLRDRFNQLQQQGNVTPWQPRYFSAMVADTETGKEALLVKNGYAAVRHEHMMLRPDLENIPDAPLPEGLVVRPVMPEHIRLIWDASQEAFRDHWGFIPAPEEEYKNWLEERTFDPSIWKVAWDGDQVAGSVLGFINPEENIEYKRLRGYTEGISVRRLWRRRGLARALLVLSLHEMKQRGMKEAALGVDSQNLNNAFRLYESVGFRFYKRISFYQKHFE